MTPQRIAELDKHEPKYFSYGGYSDMTDIKEECLGAIRQRDAKLKAFEAVVRQHCFSVVVRVSDNKSVPQCHECGVMDGHSESCSIGRAFEPMNMTPCTTCYGTGEVKEPNHLGVDRDIRCPDCDGKG